MKLNNKGFAITGILYGLLILFALLVGSYLTVLTAKKNRLDGIVENIENEYSGNITNTHTLTFEKGTEVKAIYYSKDSGEYIEYNGPFSVEDVEILYYYAEPSEGYTTTCTENSPCSIEINGETKKIKIDASAATYTLTINRETGVSEIHYKINEATSYSSSTSNVTLSVKYGTTYYYYGVASSGYKMSSCTSSSPCSGTKSTSTETKTLKAVNSSPTYTVIINLMGSEEASGTTNGSTFIKTGVYTMGKTNIYCDNGASATISGSTVTVTNITTDTTCNIT